MNAPSGRERLRILAALRLRLALPFVMLIGAVLLVLALVLGARARDVYIDRLSDELRFEAHTMVDVYQLSRGSGDGTSLADVIASLPTQTDRRITLIDGSGVVLADTAVEQPGSLENHADREEIREALAGGSGEAIRKSASTGERFLYVAVPLEPDGATTVRIAVSLDDVNMLVDRMQRFLLVAAGSALVLAAALAIFIGHRLAEPLEALRAQARRVAAGDLNASVAPVSTREIDAVGAAFNSMTTQLRRSRDDLDKTRTRLEAVLGGLEDGVVLTDVHGDVLRMNRAAERMLSTAESKACGRPFIQVARDHELDALLEAMLAGGDPRPEAVEHGLNRRTLLSSVSRVTGRSEFLGLVVLRDITELRRLESVRRDFVANVSHELRTPLTSIRAMVETIESGAIDDPAMTDELLRRVIEEIDRLNALVEDLLRLARLEAGRSMPDLAPVGPDELIRNAAERLRPQVERRGLRLAFDLPQEMPDVLADRRQVEQVIVNLVHNAIKFTHAGGVISLTARQQPDWVLVGVADTGVGIAEDELPRVFERFYKSDKARHSEGTGLGLAIAKHIVQSHGGELTVQSRPGRGATFSFTLFVAGSTNAETLMSRTVAPTPSGFTASSRSIG